MPAHSIHIWNLISSQNKKRKVEALHPKETLVMVQEHFGVEQAKGL
jgi:hypothetical protein